MTGHVEIDCTKTKDSSRDDSSLASTSSIESDHERPRGTDTQSKIYNSEHVSTRLSQLLHISSEKNDTTIRASIHMANRWKKVGYHPYKMDASGYTALHRAAKKGDSALISVLLSMYDGPQQELAAIPSKKQAHLAVHLAAKYGRLDALRTLTTPEFRSLVNTPDRSRNTPLHFAVTCNRQTAPDLVLTLLSRGADVTIKNRHEILPIVAYIMTTQEDNPEIVTHLIKYGCDPNSCDADGNTVLHYAAKNGLWKIAATLVSHRASIAFRNGKGEMVLDRLAPQQLEWLMSFVSSSPEWVPFSMQKTCMICARRFGLIVRVHHCRLCGRICCGPCSNFKRKLPFQVHEPVKRNQRSPSTILNMRRLSRSVSFSNFEIRDTTVVSGNRLHRVCAICINVQCNAVNSSEDVFKSVTQSNMTRLTKSQVSYLERSR